MERQVQSENFIRKYWLLLLVVTVKFVLQFTLVNPYYELHRDEFLHLDQANHLSPGFISVPPFTSIISKLIFLLGGSEFWIRFFPALFGALTIVFAWLIVEELGGGFRAKLLAAFALLFSVLLRLNILFQPNSFDILVWTMIFFFFIKYLDSENNKWLWYLAVFAALGLHNKYTVVFLITGISIGLLLTPQRNLFRNTAVWKALALTILIFLPNMLWQAAKGLPVIDHMSVLKENQLDNNSGIGFLISQLKIQSGSLAVILSALTGLFFYKPFARYRFVGFAFIAVLAVFSLLKAKDYYAFGVYPVMLAFGSVYLEKVLKRSWKVIVIPALVAINLAVFLLLVRFIMPVMSPQQIIDNSEIFERSGMLRWEDGKNHQLPQDFADMTGWKEMADKAYDAYRTIPDDELDETLIICDNYGQTGAVNYYNRGRMKEAYSLSTDYIYWLPRLTRISNVILVGEMTEEKIAAMFRDFVKTGEVENEYARENGTGIFLFRGADPAFTEFFYNEAERRKKELDIF